MKSELNSIQDATKHIKVNSDKNEIVFSPSDIAIGTYSLIIEVDIDNKTTVTLTSPVKVVDKINIKNIKYKQASTSSFP